MKHAGVRVSLAVLFAAAAMVAPPAGADVQPGDIITKANVDKVKDLISPGVQWCVEHGLTMKIVPYKKIEWDKAYREATEKYSGQVKLAPDGRSIIGHVAGQPFPNIDPNDPQIALKIMWNYDYKPYWTDDWVTKLNDADAGQITGSGPMQTERHFLLEVQRDMWYTGRLYVDPKPEIPNNKDGVRYKESMHPILEPYDLKGVGYTSNRYLSPDRQDDTWLYLPSLRRVRRLSSSQRSDALFAQDTDLDSYNGYMGQIPWHEWKYLGEKEMLASFHSEAHPVKYCEPPGDFIFCDNWEKRKVYVVEGVSRLPQYAYGKRLLFLDKESYLIAYSDVFDRAGQLWKVVMNQWSFKRKATPSLGEEYPDEMPFQLSMNTVDLQLSHATRSAVPALSAPTEQGWYFNKGADEGSVEEWFNIADLVNRGH